MKIRMDRQTYTAAQRIADAEGLTFNRWAIGAIRMWMNNDARPDTMPPVTRTDSVSVAIGIVGVDPLRMRQCITLAVQHEQAKPWPWRYDRSTLKAVQQVKMYFKESCSFAQAQDFLDKRLAERTAELRVEKKAKHKKGHTPC